MEYQLQIDPLFPSKLYSGMGECLWHIQVLENTLVKYLVVRFKLKPKTARAEAHAVLEKTAKKTLGQLLKELREYDSVSPRFEAFLDERNWLVHRIREENHTDGYDRERSEALLARLRKLCIEAIQINADLMRVFTDHMTARGITSEQIEKEVTARLKSWGAI